ncbi:latent-transforming growth factor beta-binding protein 2-like [Sycon ciliatum]|uniref:latent-transforming growth factor beta-binding protein 2-like n=1 Tax=Sycon ciliatum TaxID=27933 RepID=UPI0031F63868
MSTAVYVQDVTMNSNGFPVLVKETFVSNSTFSVTLTDLIPGHVYNCSVASGIFDQRSSFRSVRVSTSPLKIVRLGLCEEWQFRCEHTLFNAANSLSYTPWEFTSLTQPLLIRPSRSKGPSAFVRIASFSDAHDGLRVACARPEGIVLYEMWFVKREESENACRTCGSCPDNALCSATRRGMHCQCQPGYILDGSACVHYDACLRQDQCAVKNNVCVRNLSSFSCECKRGYQRPHSSGPCIDTNECLETSPCGPNGRCQNSEGSFSCSCSLGYDGCGVSCEDVDECARGTHQCSDNAICVNTNASYACTCKHGYTEAGNSSTLCADIDECSLDQTVLANGTLVDLAPCPNNVTMQCKNTDGSYTCPCLSGFELNANATSDDPARCQDTDECETNNPCDGNPELDVECENTFGSFQCYCPDGFAWNTTTRQCVDQDECALGENDCDPDQGLCTNTIGAFTCSCTSQIFSAGGQSISSRQLEGNGVTCGSSVRSSKSPLFTCPVPELIGS